LTPSANLGMFWAADIWSDLQLVALILIFLFFFGDMGNVVDSKPLALILAAFIVFLLFYQHAFLLLIVSVIVFGGSFINQAYDIVTGK